MNNTQYFTSQGAGADATIFHVSTTGAVSTWSNGSNSPNDLWDINNVPTMSPDGWFTFSNHSVNPGNQREIIQCRDLNGDGDGQDAGEIRVVVGLGAPVGQQAGFAYDASGRFYHSTGADIYRHTDLNGDLDYWDFAQSDFDAGERERIVQGLSGNVLAMNVSPAGDLYAVVNESAGDSVIYRVAAKPRISIERSEGMVTLSWSAAAPGFNLQQADSLGPGTILWSDVTDSPLEANGQKSVSRSAISGTGYFRLRKGVE